MTLKAAFFCVLVAYHFRECLLFDEMQCDLQRAGSTVNIQSTIQSEHDVSKEVVEWTNKDGKDVHVRRSGEDDLAGQRTSYKGRTKLDVEEMDKGKWKLSLQLFNVTKEDEGNYTVTVSNMTLTCTVTLTLGSNVGWIVGACVGGLVLIGVIGVIIYCSCKKKKTETRRAENVNKEEAQNGQNHVHQEPTP